ncbi:unnamed protein product [Leuciscus chuanchicus]
MALNLVSLYKKCSTGEFRSKEEGRCENTLQDNVQNEAEKQASEQAEAARGDLAEHSEEQAESVMDPGSESVMGPGPAANHEPLYRSLQPPNGFFVFFVRCLFGRRLMTSRPFRSLVFWFG